MAQKSVWSVRGVNGIRGVEVRRSFLRYAGTAVLAFLACVEPAQTIGQQIAPVWALSTVAGKGTNGDTGDGGLATNATIAKPLGVAVDKAGNVYFSDGNSTIRKVDTAGIISTIAGIPPNPSVHTGYTGDGGQATAALLSSPYGLEIDRDGNLLIGDEVNQVVRKIDLSTGIITTVAGSHVAGYAGDGGAATAATAKLHTPFTAAGDSAGNMYIADYSNNVIRKVDKNGNISTFAGTGTASDTGDGGPAISATLDEPYSVWTDPAGNLYVNDVLHSYTRMIDTAGVIHTIVGNGTNGYLSDGVAATSTEFNTQHGTVIDGLGNTYIADETNDIIRMINSAGIVSTIGGIPKTTGGTGDGGVATAGKLWLPYGLAIDASNNLYEPDAGGYRIRKLSLNTAIPATAVGASGTQKLFVASSVAVTPSSAAFTPSNEFTVGTLAGCTFGTQLAANAPCTLPLSFHPSAAGLRSAQLTITDSGGNVSTIGITGMGKAPEVTFGPATISTIAGTGATGYDGTPGPATSALVSAPRGGVIDSAGNLYFADSGNHVIRRIDAVSGTITTVAGMGQMGYTGDNGKATAAQLNAPAKVVVDAAGDLYIADTGNNVIRYVDAASGNITTIAGTGTASYTGDGGAATAATLNHPQGLAVDLGGHVYVADTGNNAIRYFGQGGQISTFMGDGIAGSSGDGGNAHDATLNAPQAVLLDGAGNLYVVDTGNSVVRMVSTTNKVTTIAGSQGKNSNAGDGGLATLATLANPSDLALDPAGDLYVTANGQIRMIDGNGGISTIAGTGASGTYSGEGGVATNAVIPAPASNLIVDNAGNLFIGDTAGNLILKVALATPRTVAFGRQTPGTTGSAQRVSVLNVGNTALQFSAITVAGPFALESGDPTACTAATALAPGTSCSLSTTFSPAVVGPASGSITLTDNALNNSASTQVITLSGDGVIINTTTTTIALSPTAPVYGQTTQAVATATIAGGVDATGSVTFTLNGTTIGSAPLVGATASLNLPSLQAGSYSLAASYAGDDNNSSSSGTTPVTVQPAVLTITAVDTSRYYFYEPNPVFTYSMAGLVNGDTASVVSGAPDLTTTATKTSPVGSYPITAMLGSLAAANYTFTLVDGTLAVTPAPPPDYTISATPSALAMQNGGSATFTISLTSLYGYTGTDKFSCNAPANVNCSFNPAVLTGDPNATVSSQVTIFLGSAYASSFAGSRWLALAVVLMMLSLGVQRRRIIFPLTLSIAFLAGAFALSGCGSQVNTLPATGTSQVTITATDAGGTLHHGTSFTLTIQ